MPRATFGVARRRWKHRILKKAKGFWGFRGKLIRHAEETLFRAGQFAFRDRQAKKRFFRRLWISRISAAVRARGINYSQFIKGLNKAKITLNRKSLAHMAVTDPAGFDRIVALAKQAI